MFPQEQMLRWDPRAIQGLMLREPRSLSIPLGPEGEFSA